MDQEQIGKFIAGLRKQKSMTQEQFAEILGVNSRSISRWETGRCMPDLSLLQTIAKELDISISELLNGRKNTNKELIEMRDTINDLIEYSTAEKENKARKLNKYFVWGATCNVILILNYQFDILSYVFKENAACFIAGLLSSLGVIFILFAFYNNNYDLPIAEKKRALFRKITKRN